MNGFYINVYGTYTLNRQSQTTGGLKYQIFEKENANLNEINIFGCFDSNINNLQNSNRLEYVSIVNYSNIIYDRNDNNDLLYNYSSNIYMLFCRIITNNKIKILFPQSFEQMLNQTTFTYEVNILLHMYTNMFCIHLIDIYLYKTDCRNVFDTFFLFVKAIYLFLFALPNVSFLLHFGYF